MRQNWYQIGQTQGVRAGTLGGELQRHQLEFADEVECAAWIDGVFDGVMSVGGRVAGVTSVRDMMPGSKGGVIHVITIQRQV